MYETMGMMHANYAAVEKTILFHTANLFNLEVVIYEITTDSFPTDYADDLERID